MSVAPFFSTPSRTHFFDRKSKSWKQEQAEIRRKIGKHEIANHNYLDEGVRILELANKAVNLYEEQEMMEKRRLLDFVFLNSTWKNGYLSPTYRKPFDMLAVTNIAYQKQKAASPSKDDLFAIRHDLGIRAICIKEVLAESV